MAFKEEKTGEKIEELVEEQEVESEKKIEVKKETEESKYQLVTQDEMVNFKLDNIAIQLEEMSKILFQLAKEIK